ncbi:hypothetical protein WP1_079 [Pseudomonas phage WP1]
MSGEGEVAELISQVRAILARLEGTVAEEADEEHYRGQMSSRAWKNRASSAARRPPATMVVRARITARNFLKWQKNAQDAAVRGLYRDIAAKDRLYRRLSSVVGAFDHRAMDSAEVAVYGVKKLAISVRRARKFWRSTWTRKASKLLVARPAVS